METAKYQHYEVLRREDGTLWELGRGAMGVTYKAFDVNLRCFVALKVIRADSLDHPIARQRFVREARAAAQLRHRNIGSVYHLGLDDAEFFYAMEFIDGETLNELVERTGPLPVAAALRVTLQIARALAAAARARVVHRDIKPGNLMVINEDGDGDDDEGEWLVKVIDFGLARTTLPTDSIPHLTVSGFVGTPQFASPEQLEEKELDTRSDIYSLGVTLWYLLAGRPPFSGSLSHVIAQHLSKPPPWGQLPPVPEDVRALLERMLQKNPAQRPQTPAELRREIEACLGIRAGTESGDLPRLVPRTPLVDSGPEPADAPQVLRPRRDGPALGTMVGDRYLLQRLAGEGHSGCVYEARDVNAAGHRAVAVKVFTVEVIGTSAEFDALCDEVEKVQDAPHPNLIALLSLERSFGRACLVMEWAGDRTLVDVLRAQGAVRPAEALDWLRQAIEASEHALSHGLRPLEFGLHQILVGRASSTSCDVALSHVREEVLKFDALGLKPEAGALPTWAGGITMVPGQMTRGSLTWDAGELADARCIRALAALFFELVDGAPPPSGPNGAGGAGGFLSLAPLGEAGNAVLRRGLRPEPDVENARAFYEQLRAAIPASAPKRGSIGEQRDAPLVNKEKVSLSQFEDGAETAAPLPAVARTADIRPTRPRLFTPTLAGVSALCVLTAFVLVGQMHRPGGSPGPTAGAGPRDTPARTAAPSPSLPVLRAQPTESNPSPIVSADTPAEESIAADTPAPTPPQEMSPTPATASQATASESPSASPGDDEEDAGSPGKPDPTPRRTTASTRSHRTRRASQPNFFQRIFGIKPKPSHTSR